MNTWILSLKFLLVSAALVSLAVGLRLSLPIAVDGVPAFILSWLKPPYLYLIINGIIITILASSHFHRTQSDRSISETESFESFSAHPDITTTSAEEPIEADVIVELKPVTENLLKEDEETVAEEAEDGDVFVDWTLKQMNTPSEEMMMISPELQLESQFPVREKPLVRSRFGHRKPNRTAPAAEGARALRVARAKKHETLESTWKMITEGRHVPLNRHLKKTDTWEQGHSDLVVESDATVAPAKVAKEASLGQEELNRRVEAFIKKFNEEMRVQRQESLNQYMEMINRGV